MNFFRKIAYTGQLLLMHLFAKAQYASFAQVPHNNRLQTSADSIVHHLAETFFKKATAPGLAIGIVQDGKPAFYQYGYADTATQQPFTEQTVFEAGSVTKTFVANLLFQLVQEGRLSASDPVTRYLPDSVAANTRLQKILLSHLASQASGLPRLPANLDKAPGFTMMQPYRHYTTTQLYEFLKNVRPSAPGSYGYSNLGFGLLGTVLENREGQPLEALLRKHIFSPLHMNNSWLANSPGNQQQATGYFNGKPAAFWDFNCLAGAGAVKSTMSDMLLYLQAHLAPTGITLLDASVKAITKKTATVSMTVDIGYGWHIFNSLKYPLYWHNGGTYGFSTFGAFEPHTRTCIFVVANGFNNNAGVDKLGVDLAIFLTSSK